MPNGEHKHFFFHEEVPFHNRLLSLLFYRKAISSRARTKSHLRWSDESTTLTELKAMQKPAAQGGICKEVRVGMSAQGKGTAQVASFWN